MTSATLGVTSATFCFEVESLLRNSDSGMSCWLASGDCKFVRAFRLLTNVSFISLACSRRGFRPCVVRSMIRFFCNRLWFFEGSVGIKTSKCTLCMKR